MTKKTIFTLLKMIVLLSASAIIGMLLLSAAFFLPTDRIKENVRESVPGLVSEGDHFSLFSGLRFTEQDNYSDALYLNGAMVDNSAKGFFTGLYGLEYENSKVKIKEDSPVTVLNNVFLEDAEPEYREYGRRFWNGYEIVLKILLQFFNYGQIRFINFYAEIGVLFWLAFMMYRRGLTKYIITVLISYIFLGPVTIAVSMSFGGFMYCTYIPCILMLLSNDRLKQKQRYPLFFMAVGICVAYFNMNYFQLITFVYPLVFYYLLNGFPKDNKRALSSFTVLFASWVAGFTGMYAMKWVLYELFTGQPLISDMIKRTLYRISATEYYTGPPISRIGALGKNLFYLIVNIPWLLFETLYILWIKKPFSKGKKESAKTGIFEFARSNSPVIILILMVTVLVLLRYLLFANHVYVHAWVMFRIADGVIFTLNVLMIYFSGGESIENEKISGTDKV